MKKLRKILIILLILAAVVGATMFGLHKLKMKNQNSKTADVYPVGEIGYDASYMWDSSTLSGSVTASTEQKIYVGSSQKISEIRVQEGQTVKAGDVLLVYDVTSQNLQLALQKSELELARVDIIKAKRELEELKATTPLEDIPIPEPPASPTDDYEPPVIDAPTKDELAKMIQEKQNSITSMQIRYDLDEIAIQMTELQNGNGEVYANFDGVVKSLLPENEAASTGQPVLVVGTSEGYMVETQIGELALGHVAIGDTVSMTCYDNGMTYEGTITEVSSMPIEQNYYYYGSKVESYYPMKIAIADATDVRQNMYMEITLDTTDEDTSNGFYLSKAFMKQEGSNYYVLKDVDGILTKTYIKVGKKQNGDSILVLGGITMSDYIAFPYVEEAVEGVKTVQKTAMDLYNY